jgi:hypothetical protein
LMFFLGFLDGSNIKNKKKYEKTFFLT